MGSRWQWIPLVTVALLLLSILAGAQGQPGADYDAWLSKLDGARFTRDWGDQKYTFTIRGRHVNCSYTYPTGPAVYYCGMGTIQGRQFVNENGVTGILSEDGSHMLIIPRGGNQTVYPRE